MQFKEFKILEDKINNQDFNKGYKTINNVMTFLSYFGHVASIFLAFFMLSKILSGAMTDNTVAVFISTVIILSGLELLKRDLFTKFAIGYLKVKSFTKDVMPLFILSLTVISLSFYSSINGASEFSSKSKEIETDKKEILTKYTDSVSLVYNTKVKDVESEIKTIKMKIDEKDKEQTDIEAIQPLMRQQKSRIKDLKDEKASLKSDVVKLQTDITNIKTELSTTLKQKEEEVASETNDQKDSNSSNSLAFVLISTLIEIVILAGVYFNEYYKFRSYKEYRDKIERDPNFQKWMIYDQILNVIYTEDVKINQKLPSNKAMIDICKVNGLIILQKDMVDFIKVMNGLNILKVSGASRYINKQRDIAFEVLKKHFNIE